MNELEFATKLTPKDMFRFNMYHTYTSLNGIITFVLAALVLAFAYVKRDSISGIYMFMYIVLAVILVVYTPINLYLKTRRQVLGSEVLSNELRYSVDDEGITVQSEVSDENSTLNFKDIYAIRQSKHNLLVYSTRVNAFVIPLDAIGDKYDDLSRVLREYVEPHKLPKQMKRG